MAIDISRSTTGVVLPAEVSSEIWSDTQEQSAVMQLAPKMTIPGSGKTIPVVTGDPAADWVGETDEINVSRGTVSSKTMTPYKLGLIEPFSNEFKRDLPGLYAELKSRLPGAVAKKFDATVFGSSAPGSGFDTLGGVTAVKLAPHASDVKKGSYAGLTEAWKAVAAAGGDLDGWALSSQALGLLLDQVDSTGRPLLTDSIKGEGAGDIGALLRRRVVKSKGVYAAGSPNQIGFAGDWSSTRWGMVESISISVSDQASITDGIVELEVGEETVEIPKVLNLWQRDMFALKIVVELGFIRRDASRFVRFTDAART